MAIINDLERRLRPILGRSLASLKGRRATPDEVRQMLDDLRTAGVDSANDMAARFAEITARLDDLAVSVQTLREDVGHVRALAEQEVVGQDQQERRHLDQFLHLDARQVALAETLESLKQIATAQYENVYPLRSRLVDVRQTERYLDCYTDGDPLITVRIATYNRPHLLVGRAIPSILQQTHQNFEIVIVGDGCDQETGRQIAEIDDPRITYRNLPHRGMYPEEPVARWKVAGTPAINRGAEMARGRWIAPLDEDDEMAPDHLQQLLSTALNGRHEMVYGRVRQRFGEPSRERVIGEYPPNEGQFNFGGALYHATLRFFEWDPHAWVVNDPGDWHLCRQMIDAGVDIGFVDAVVTTLYVTGPRTEG